MKNYAIQVSQNFFFITVYINCLVKFLAKLGFGITLTTFSTSKLKNCMLLLEILLFHSSVPSEH